MTQSTNKLSQFWQELKRRKVIKVIAMYAGAAYVLIELANNVVAPLNLPDWTPRLVILFVIIGFPVTVILSWIFDITPDGIKKTKPDEVSKEEESTQLPARRRLKISDGIIALLFVVVCILFYPKIFSKEKFEDIKDEDGRISIAVLPFENLTGDTTLNWFQRGISSLIINGLGNSSALAVRDDHTMFEAIESMNHVFTAGISSSQAKEVAEKVQAETYISGSCQGRGGEYRILINLVDTKSGDIIWTDMVEGDLKSSKYLDLADSLCNKIKDYLEIKVLKQEVDFDYQAAYTKSAQGYRYYIEGMNSILTLDYESAIQSLTKALEIDSTFALASFYITYVYVFDFYHNFQPEQRNIWIQKVYYSKDRLPSEYRLWLELWHAIYISKNLNDIIRFCNLLEESGTESRFFWFNLGYIYNEVLRQYEKAIDVFEKVEEINLKRECDWKYVDFYFFYGRALYRAGKHNKEKEISEIGAKLFPLKGRISANLAICALSRSDTIKANESITKLRAILKGYGYSEAVIEFTVGSLIYEEANIISQAEIHLRNAYSLEPQYIQLISSLAFLLIDNDINVDEGMSLVQKGLELFHESSSLLEIKGLGLYKQGSYVESLKFLRKAEKYELEYNYELDHLIEEVEQVLANQNQ